jgi:5-methylcytosine-specific restriction endonuclease McrA
MSKRRRTIWEITDGKCFYCGCKLTPFKESKHISKNAFAIEHYIPASKCAGLASNLFPSCFSCNAIKSDKSISEFRKLMKKKSYLSSFPYFSPYQKTWLLDQGFTFFVEAKLNAPDYLFWAERNGWELDDCRAVKAMENM